MEFQIYHVGYFCYDNDGATYCTCFSGTRNECIKFIKINNETIIEENGDCFVI